MGQTASVQGGAPEQQAFNVARFLRAAREGNAQRLIACLVTPQADVNVTNKFSLTALHLASKEGHEDIVRELLHRNADPNIKTKRGNTALHIAAVHGQRGVCALLLANGADINAQCKRGYTPLYLAVMENRREVVTKLLGEGANTTIGPGKVTPIKIAEILGHDDLVCLLKKRNSHKLVSSVSEDSTFQ